MPSTARSTRSTSTSSATFSDMRSMGAARITFMMRGAASTDVSPARGTGARRSRRSIISTCSYSQVRCLNLFFSPFFAHPFDAQGSTGSTASGRRTEFIKSGWQSPVDGMLGYSSNHSHRTIGYQRILDLSSSLDVIHSVDRWMHNQYHSGLCCAAFFSSRCNWSIRNFPYQRRPIPTP
jgi:hypothetical protein